MYLNVNLKLLTKLVNSAFVGECVNCVDFKTHGATIKEIVIFYQVKYMTHK